VERRAKRRRQVKAFLFVQLRPIFFHKRLLAQCETLKRGGAVEGGKGETKEVRWLFCVVKYAIETKGAPHANEKGPKSSASASKWGKEKEERWKGPGGVTIPYANAIESLYRTNRKRAGGRHREGIRTKLGGGRPQSRV